MSDLISRSAAIAALQAFNATRSIEAINNMPAFQPAPGAKIIHKLVVIADWAAGEGFCGPEGQEEPDELLYDLWNNLGANEDYSTDVLASRLYAHIITQANLTCTVEAYAKGLEHGDFDNVRFALNQPMCCNGIMCGCRGSSVGEYLAYELRQATDRTYMIEALVSLLGPNGLAVWKMWQDKGVTRTHTSWGNKAHELTGEERAQVLLDLEAAPKVENVNLDRSLEHVRFDDAFVEGPADA